MGVTGKGKGKRNLCQGATLSVSPKIVGVCDAPCDCSRTGDITASLHYAGVKWWRLNVDHHKVVFLLILSQSCSLSSTQTQMIFNRTVDLSKSIFKIWLCSLSWFVRAQSVLEKESCLWKGHEMLFLGRLSLLLVKGFSIQSLMLFDDR